jgi:bifunctional DNA-binding transcriptional regulator/antitoxin component of YhaV-PrlF toxin-antitoxin module
VRSPNRRTRRPEPVPLEARAADALSGPVDDDDDGRPRFATGPGDPPQTLPGMAGTGTDDVRERLRRARRGSVEGAPVTDLPRRRIARVNAAAPEAILVGPALIADVQHGGRVAAGKGLRAMGWEPGRWSVTSVGVGFCVISAVSGQAHHPEATIDERRRIVLPHGVRRLVGLEPGRQVPAFGDLAGTHLAIYSMEQLHRQFTAIVAATGTDAGVQLSAKAEHGE